MQDQSVPSEGNLEYTTNPKASSAKKSMRRLTEPEQRVPNSEHKSDISFTPDTPFDRKNSEMPSMEEENLLLNENFKKGESTIG